MKLCDSQQFFSINFTEIKYFKLLLSILTVCELNFKRGSWTHITFKFLINIKYYLIFEEKNNFYNDELTKILVKIYKI